MRKEGPSAKEMRNLLARNVDTRFLFRAFRPLQIIHLMLPCIAMHAQLQAWALGSNCLNLVDRDE